MRLGQLSRKTGLKPTEIVSFLSKQGISIESGSNAKIEDEHVGLVYEGFDLELPPAEEEHVETTVKQADDTAVDQDESMEAQDREIDNLDPVSEIKILYDPATEEDEFTQAELEEIKAKLAAQKLAAEEAGKPVNPDLIKAPKVSLPGLKVVGKIELPEPKVKEEETPEEEPATKEVVRNKKRNPNQQRNAGRNRNKDINPVELERRKQANAARARKRRQIAEEKERKRQFYLKQVQEKAAAEQIVSKTTAPVAEPEKSAAKPRIEKRRNFLARLWRSLDAKDPADS